MLPQHEVDRIKNLFHSRPRNIVDGVLAFAELYCFIQTLEIVGNIADLMPGRKWSELESYVGLYGKS